MKKIIFVAVMLISCAFCANSQNVTRDGNTFRSVTNAQRAKADTLVTSFQYEDSRGLKYPIVINKSTGRCYVWKTSAKTGRLYKQYMNEKISKDVCQELNIIYVPKK